MDKKENVYDILEYDDGSNTRNLSRALGSSRTSWLSDSPVLLFPLFPKHGSQISCCLGYDGMILKIGRVSNM
jgi:hypothetical protein